jgi:two-component system, NtrC family, sensor kinase
VTKESITDNWTNLIEEQLQTGQSVAIGIFDVKGRMQFANSAMCFFLDADKIELKPKNVFVNPEFASFATNSTSELIFHGLMTIGNRRDISYDLNSKVYRRDDEILVLAEVDVPFLFEENKKMSILNQEVNNLQRQLIKEKQTLQNTLIELKETQQMLIHSEKMNAMGKLVAGVAHELNNPISYVYSNLFSLEKYISEVFGFLKDVEKLIHEKANTELQEAVEEFYKKVDLNSLLEDITDMTGESKMGIERVKTIVQDLRTFSKLDESEIKEIDLIQNIKSTINITQSAIARKHIEFKLNGPEKLMLECYPGQLNQAIMNVLVNAIDAVDEGGEISLSVMEEANKVSIAVSDNGKGIPDEIKGRIFEPFFTTKLVGDGVGLGLSITYKIIYDLHHGSIDVKSVSGQGTTFKITIPLKIA